MTKYYRIPVLNNKQNEYAVFVNDYEPYQEIRNFRKNSYSEQFDGFSKTPIIFERAGEKNNKPSDKISDFLVNDWGQVIVSERIANMLVQKYDNEIEFYQCFANDNGQMHTYYILRPKQCVDCLDRKLAQFDFLGDAIKAIINEEKVNNNFFSIKNADGIYISEELCEDIKSMNATCFEPWRVATSTEELAARQKKNNTVDGFSGPGPR